MLRLPHFIVAPEVVELFGGEGAARSLLAETYSAYPCAVCGKTGQLDTDTPATVLVTIYDQGMGPLVVRLAHPDCSKSGVVLVLHAPTPTGQLSLPAMAWLRQGEPPSVVVVAPRVSARNIANGGDLTDVILSGLLNTGFTLLAEPNTTLDAAPGRVHVTFGTGQRITITTSDGTTLYDGSLPVPDGWTELAQYTGLLGVVVVRGLDLLDPDRDHHADLHAAIARGAAVGIAVQVDPRPRPEPTQPALPPSNQTWRRS
ncbi:hypothetical protein ACQEVC_34665 [Plantactinospora sp. CA-294935]|uniref:hypothetical protein n=1 Tax=Plantactinospora sp. CA-294935 TaxID=3240012 RepID=UPI003D8FEFD3